MSRFKTYTLEGSSQPGSFQTKKVSIKLCKLFKLNYGLEETDGKLLLTPLQGNYWNQNLHGLHMKRYIQESLSVVFFFFRVLFKKMENVICCVYMPWCKHEIRVLGEFKTIVTNCKPQKNSFLLRCFYSGNFPEKKLLPSFLFMALMKRAVLTSCEVLYV